MLVLPLFPSVFVVGGSLMLRATATGRPLHLIWSWDYLLGARVFLYLQKIVSSFSFFLFSTATKLCCCVKGAPGS
jgi:hypothetical protein